ncbi:MAG: hypothetical protein J6N45_09590 [Alphaproteobacteria bacterium]|nr:hypothetical protein [Alphaproteobacteria bacterium]
MPTINNNLQGEFATHTLHRMEKVLGSYITDEQVLAFLHHTEFSYKKENKMLPIHRHRAEYEAYVDSKFPTLNKIKLDRMVSEYRLYKKNQDLKITMANLLESSILPKLKEFSRQKVTGYHGLEHTELVALRAVDIAISEGYTDTRPLMITMLAAAIHDCARTDNGYNTYHGPEAAKMPEVQKFLDSPEFDLTSVEKQQIKSAAYYHTTAQPYDGKKYDYVQKCLCDADRIRLSWQSRHDAKYFFTSLGDKLGRLSAYQAVDYLSDWDALYKKSGIRPLCGTFRQKYKVCDGSHGHKVARFIEPHQRWTPQHSFSSIRE